VVRVERSPHAAHRRDGVAAIARQNEVRRALADHEPVAEAVERAGRRLRIAVGTERADARKR
jgi:hypothetical protein